MPADDGRLHVDGLTLFTWLDGDPPSSDHDWRAVADTLQHLHSVTLGWPQRPGYCTVNELTHLRSSGDARLDCMPAEVVERLLAAWVNLADEPLSVVHGDPGLGNIRIHREKVGLLDWDEARVDVSLLDLGAISPCLPGFTDAERLRRGWRAVLAWEIANAWLVEPEYARRRLQELEQG